MELIRGCLMTLGLIMLLMITSCVVGVSSCRGVINPTRFARTIDEEPDKTRRMLRDFLATAEVERAQVTPERPMQVTVQDFSDGSIHVVGTSNGQKLVEVTAAIRPADAGETRVEVVSDARPLADAARGVSQSGLHRAIKDQLDGAMSAIDQHQVLPRGFLMSRVISDARGARL